MPFQGTAPNDTFIRTDGTRTGVAVWEQAQAAGVNILATAHDRHDQDIASAINLLNSRINSAIASEAMILVSQTTAAAAADMTFTLATGYHNIFMLDNLLLSSGAGHILDFNFLDASAILLAGNGDYRISREGYNGATAGAFGDHDTAISAIQPFTAFGAQALSTASETISGKIEVFGGQDYATDSFQKIQGTLTLQEGGALTISTFVGNLAVQRSVTAVKMTLVAGTVLSGHVTHYKVRRV